MGDTSKLVDIEHHGRHDHSSIEENDSDRDRVNGLKEMGFEVIELTSSEVNDLYVYECIIERIAKLLGKKLDKSKFGPTPARVRLRKELTVWNRSSGKIR
jgi:very-short-patch-repair endonuclease